MSIDLVLYRPSGDDLLGLETVASVSGGRMAGCRPRLAPAAPAAARARVQ
ncbi:hypothetical protein [Streptomyces chartreusis]|uniref:Uncharacterized protein n=1 Tax=Streptomyces chartreusis TaxID=1969 RepID=A0A7I0Y8U1_STRCX|nr:hypothetical protein [Streptomyces chartreusis]QKZ15922.1 hypothetical protein HUT05_02135 [Streptomyces chartreusis]